MKNKKFAILFLIVIIISGSFCALGQKSNSGLHPRLPIAKNTVSDSKYDSALFSIELKDSLIMVSDNFKSKIVKDFTELEDFLCEEIKNNHIDRDNTYPVNLLIDSLTPYLVVDKLQAELARIGFNLAYYKTQENGFPLVFPNNNKGIPDLLIEVGYGSEFIKKRNIIDECTPKRNDVPEDIGNIPPPPPPPPSPFDLFKYNVLYTSDSSKYPNNALIEFKSNNYFINGNKYSFYDFINILNKKQYLFIKLSKDNSYNDLIKMVDIINGLQNEKFELNSVKEYNKPYSSLDNSQARYIRHKYGYLFVIVDYLQQMFTESY